MKKHAKQSDLAIITKGLANIREGILNANWDNVCDGYNLIAGEKLNVPDTPPIHLLDSIRQIVNSPQDEETDEGRRSYSSGCEACVEGRTRTGQEGRETPRSDV